MLLVYIICYLYAAEPNKSFRFRSLNIDPEVCLKLPIQPIHRCLVIPTSVPLLVVIRLTIHHMCSAQRDFITTDHSVYEETPLQTTLGGVNVIGRKYYTRLQYVAYAIVVRVVYHNSDIHTMYNVGIQSANKRLADKSSPDHCVAILRRDGAWHSFVYTSCAWADYCTFN